LICWSVRSGLHGMDNTFKSHFTREDYDISLSWMSITSNCMVKVNHYKNGTIQSIDMFFWATYPVIVGDMTDRCMHASCYLTSKASKLAHIWNTLHYCCSSLRRIFTYNYWMSHFHLSLAGNICKIFGRNLTQ
jgi:hypothetical protein